MHIAAFWSSYRGVCIYFTPAGAEDARVKHSCQRIGSTPRTPGSHPDVGGSHLARTHKAPGCLAVYSATMDPATNTELMIQEHQL